MFSHKLNFFVVVVFFFFIQKGEVAAISELFPFTKFFENAPQVRSLSCVPFIMLKIKSGWQGNVFSGISVMYPFICFGFT